MTAFRHLNVSDTLRAFLDEALREIIHIEHEKDIVGVVDVFLEVGSGRYLKTETDEKKFSAVNFLFV